MADQKHVVIVGAGFGGVRLAKELAKENVHITLVDRHNYHLFQPLLYQVSTAVLSAAEIAYPTRAFFKHNNNVDFFMAKATGVDQGRRVLLTDRLRLPCPRGGRHDEFLRKRERRAQFLCHEDAAGGNCPARAYRA